MDTEKEHNLRISQMGFVGKMIGGFTHELKNHLAIIKETAGLIEDLIVFGKREGKDDSAKYIKSLDSIALQVDKTVQLADYLNRFSHRMDQPFSTFSVHDAIEELIALRRRSASQRGICFETDFHGAVPAIHSDPARLYCLLYCLIEEKMRVFDKGSHLIIKTEPSGGSILIRIIPKGKPVERIVERIIDKSICMDEVVQEIIETLKAAVRHERESGVTTIAVPLDVLQDEKK
jgi:nitrogen-specific signal transduction histidine kinase